MKRIIALTVFIIFVLGCVPCMANTTDKGLVKNYCSIHYKNYKVVYFTKWNQKKMTHRKGKHIVYVEKVVSTSKGKYGYTKDKFYITYNKKVKKGKKVISYCIYNPKSNYIDDIVAVVDNKKIR